MPRATTNGRVATGAAIRIVPATESDIPEILDLIHGLAEYEDLQDQMTATEDGLREALFGSQPGAEALLAFCEVECVGYALFFPTYCTMLGRRGIFLDNLFVRPEWRGKGIGDALLRRLAGIAAERNCARLEWMVLNWNQSAIGFYQAKGAVLLDGWTKCRMTEEDFQGLSQGEDGLASSLRFGGC
jgi:GNAT superfamily N-acetyltransferase